MNTKKWTRKDKIACTIIFVVSILTFVVFLSTMTLSYFYDEHSANKVIVAGKVSVKITVSGVENAKLQFPEILTPNTTYNVSEYSGLNCKVTNTSTSGNIYLMIKLKSEYIDIIRPITTISYNNVYFVYGNGTDDASTPEVEDNCRYLFYMKSIGPWEYATLCDSWQVGNYTNKLKGSEIDYEITAYAVQTQGGAVQALMDGHVDGWQYAPEIFRNMVAA